MSVSDLDICQSARLLIQEHAERARISGMLRPFAAERMSAWKVSKDVDAVKNQGDYLVERADA